MACTLNYSPVVNNVEKCGGLPEEICSAAKHIMANGGGARPKAIAAAVNFVKFVCDTGKSKNFMKSNPGMTVAPEKRARACANVAAWERLKACMKGKPPVGGKAAGDTEWERLNLAIDMLNLADELAEAQRTPRGKIIEPDESILAGSADSGIEGKAETCAHGACEISTHLEADFEAALDVKAVSETEDGIWIEGKAADWDVDREDEAFEPGALDSSIESFMQNPVLAFHHTAHTPLFEMTNGKASNIVQLGQVRELRKEADGMHMKAFIPKPQHPFLQDIYDKIKRGMLRGLSVGGRFHKHRTPRGWRIHNMDLMEISVTPQPVNPRTLFQVVPAAVGGKAGLDWKPPAENEKLAAELLEILG